jgi:hypothetical protein
MQDVDVSEAESLVQDFKKERDLVQEAVEALEAATETTALALIDRFEDNLTLAMGLVLELLQEFFQKATGHANRFYESLKDLAVNTIAAYEPEAVDPVLPSEDGVDQGPSDPYLHLLSNVDAMMEVTQRSPNLF